VLNVGRTSLLAHIDIPLGQSQWARFTELVQRRATGEPVAYIRGIKEFYGLAFSVDERALIPRPETETLVGIALERVQAALVAAARPTGTPQLLIWDIGTGSGAVAVALAVEFRRRGYATDVRLLATDTSADALSLAVENAVAHGVADAIDFATADLTAFASDGSAGHARRAEMIVANLPYIPSDAVPGLPVAASFEPRAALDGGADGLGLIGRLLDLLPESLMPGGLALLEIGSDQAAALGELVTARLPGWLVTVHDDLSGRPRVAELRRGSGT
jgi:release factor glutamine methyltransferase